MPKRVLDVGNCDLDHAAIARLVRDRFGAETARAHLADEAIDRLHRESFDLVLVNRKLDRDDSDGKEVVRRIKQDPDLAAIPVMLITNFPEHQQAAVECGAEPGFGKRQLDLPATREKLARFLA